MNAIRRRLPAWPQVIPVYGVIVLMVYTWTFMWLFWRLPSWLHFMRAGEIAAAVAFSLVTNLVESLLVLAIPLLLALSLPRSWFSEVFVARGTSLCIAVLASLMFLATRFESESKYPAELLQPVVLLLLAAAIAALIYLCGRIPALRNALELVADRASIFVYILVPLSCLSLLFVAVRTWAS